MEPKKIIEVVGGIICRDGKYLLGKRPLGKSQGGLWEFVGGKIEPGETPEQALARECMEEIDLPIVNARYRIDVTHSYPDRTVHLIFSTANRRRMPSPSPWSTRRSAGTRRLKCPPLNSALPTSNFCPCCSVDDSEERRD